ncbi:hypothetical protein BDV37DRAFT_159153 [Aspergillus pseudonomiae]|uniref:Uncharacterized protein n=1 Tax=Aspergillus pseudonomiae TaxID=1506151 RepID=A0A5N7DTJ3_9EURO|nr:uncharacterized protein BDV37DRAFT_159153 [Aspergillus pseudonomiae]KAE8408828.1 hypothetical protein BDV37DRAFT_159153 [Aspergillus pseudonomiae]
MNYLISLASKMFQLRTKLLRHERTRLVDGCLSPIRQFSVIQGRAKDASQSGNDAPKVRSLHPGVSYARASPRKTNLPPANLNSRKTDSDKPRPRRVFDARSLAAPSANGQSTNILRSTSLRNPRKGPSIRARRPKPPTKLSTKSRKSGRPQRAKNTDMEEIDVSLMENVYRELAEKSRPTPSRYKPQVPDLSNLKETWPSFPTGTTASTAEVVEKLSSLSGRFPNGYVPPYELGMRLFRGQFVQFLDEEEKAQAIADAKKLSQQRADNYSQRKGDLVEPEDVGFLPMSAEDRKSLVQSYIQGAYPKLSTEEAAQSPVLSEVTKNLRNNESYQAAGKSSQFVAKVESLLSSARPVRRA